MTYTHTHTHTATNGRGLLKDFHWEY